ncbi:MAG: hypothetical protein LBS45_08540 [Synergistaceae bacterium]|jgi:hypothetical protein|nr:hypothetical protein [Synergistaceae bacterium]
MKKKQKHKFVLFDEGHAAQTQAESGVLLYPFRNMSAHSFSFPFSGISRVRDALMIQFRPLLGEGSGGVSVIPFFVKSERKLSTGCVFALSGGETADLEENAGDGNYIVWPAPLAAAGEVGGSGIIVWTDGDLIMTVCLDNWAPVYYKTAGAEDSDAGTEREQAIAYAVSRGYDAGNVFMADRKSLSSLDIQRMGEATIAGCPAYGQLDLSNRGTNLLERREKLVASLTSAGRAAAVSAAVMLCLALGVYLHHTSVLEAGRASVGAVYAAAFGEKSSGSPLSSAMTKLRAVSSPDADLSFGGVMRGMSSVWDKLGASDDISIEILRYGGENTDLTGKTKSNESIQRLRSLLEEEGFTPTRDNIQQIPGGYLRFNLTISRGDRR